MADFGKAIEYVLRNEGGYVDDPDDPGGATKYGITARDHPDLDIKNLTLDHAHEIYLQQYWCYEGIEDQRVATKLLDMAVNMEGTGRHGWAVRILQMAVNCQLRPEGALRVDGDYGPMTEAAINHAKADTLLRDMCRLAADRYCDLIERNPKFVKYQRNWLMRAARLPQAQPAAHG